MRPTIPRFVLAAAVLLAAPLARAQPDVEALADRHNCFSCHRVDERHVGPAYRDVARRYRDDPQAVEKLMAKVRRGGGGNWGTVAMPANSVAEAELRVLVRWVLSRS